MNETNINQGESPAADPESATAAVSAIEVSPEVLAEQIKSCDTLAAQLRTELDQSEAAAVDASTDPDRYDRAAEAVRDLQGRIGRIQEKRARLDSARVVALERERGSEIERLEAEHADQAERARQVADDVRGAADTEVRRHNAAVAELADRLLASKVAPLETRIRIAAIALSSARDAVERAESSGNSQDVADAQTELHHAELNAKSPQNELNAARAAGVPVACQCFRRYLPGLTNTRGTFGDTAGIFGRASAMSDDVPNIRFVRDQ